VAELLDITDVYPNEALNRYWASGTREVPEYSFQINAIFSHIYYIV
jgi:hypothetical protein